MDNQAIIKKVASAIAVSLNRHYHLRQIIVLPDREVYDSAYQCSMGYLSSKHWESTIFLSNIGVMTQEDIENANWFKALRYTKAE